MSNHASAEGNLLEVRNLVVDYEGKRGTIFRAVDDVSLHIRQGETLGLVGESGSGKSTIGRAIQGLIRPMSGTIELDSLPITAGTTAQRRGLAADVQTVFQDPFGSLNPARTIGATLEETLRVQEPRLTRTDAARRVAQELHAVGLPSPAAKRLPQEFSGGQRQRIAIARALIARPRLVICDEAVSALDLSIQAQVLNLLRDLQVERGISYLFITHDLAVVRHMAERVAVLRRGKIVDVLKSADHDKSGWSTYTKRLFDAAPVPDPALQREKRKQFEQSVQEEETGAALS